MPPCGHPDCNELQTEGPPSPGVIEDGERIVRGAYDSHYNKSNLIKGQFPRLKDIVGRELSIWRMDKGLAGDPVATRMHLENHGPAAPMREGIIFEVAALREIQTRTNERALCVFDDTHIDLQGNRHQDHAAIGLCKLIDPAPYTDSESDESMSLIRTIVALANKQRELGRVV